MINVPVKLVKCYNPSAMSWPDTLSAAKVARKKFEAIGVFLNIDFRPIEVSFPDNMPEVPSTNPFALPGILRSQFIKRTPLKELTVYHLLCRPIVVGENKFIGGTGGNVGSPKNEMVSVSSCFYPRTLLQVTLKEQIMAIGSCMAHEIGHVLGASHNEEPPENIMSSHLNFYNSMKFTKFCRKERTDIINHCKKIGF